MKWNQLLLTCACTVAMAAPVMAASRCECVPGKSTAESYDWNFHREANQLIQQIQDEADTASRHATKLQSYGDSPDLSWQAHAEQLADLKSEINHMSRDLCRLETIRTAATPWQQKTIDRIAKDVVLMSNNAKDAINYVTSRQGDLWNPTYKLYTDNLANLSANLQKTTNRAVEFAHVNAKDRQLRRAMRLGAAS